MPRSRARLSPLCAFGHVATHAELLEAFHNQESALIPFRMGAGLTTYLRHNTFVCAHLTELERLAPLCGGHLDCVTVLAERGLPVADGGEPHLRLPRGQGGVSVRRQEYAPTAHVHWSRQRTPVPSMESARRAAQLGSRPDRLRVPVREALRQAMTSCLTYAQSADLLSAMYDAGFPAADLAHALTVAPRRVQAALRRLGAIPPEVWDVLADALARQNHS